MHLVFSIVAAVRADNLTILSYLNDIARIFSFLRCWSYMSNMGAATYLGNQKPIMHNLNAKACHSSEDIYLLNCLLFAMTYQSFISYLHTVLDKFRPPVSQQLTEQNNKTS